jgi:MFS family permease
MTMAEARRLIVVLLANSLLRVASAASGALVGFYLAFLATTGRPVDSALVGTIGVVANVAELIGAVPVGMLADRYTPRTILVVSTIVGALATQLFGISGVIAIFFVSRSLESVASVAGGPALLAHLSDATRHNTVMRGRVMGYYELSLLAGLALGSLVGGTLWVAVQTYAFSLLAVIYLVCAGLFWWGSAYSAAPVGATAHPLAGLRQSLRDPLLRRLAPAWLAVNAIVGLWLTHLAFTLSGPSADGQYLVGRFQPDDVGVILLGYAIALSVGVLAWGYVLPRMTRLRALTISLSALLVLCVWLALLNAPLSWSLSAWYGLIALSGASIMVGSGFTPAALAYLADLTGRREGRGAAMGIYTMLFSLGNALGAGIGGWLASELAFNGLIIGTVALTILALLALLALPAVSPQPATAGNS